VDFGRPSGEYAVDLGDNGLEALNGLQSFTISGWVNCRDATTGPGGNRIVTTVNSGGDGFDLVFLRDGRLQLSVNQWPDSLPTQSSPGKISVDPEAGQANWRFFAVTYDSTAANDHVTFYFGTAGQPAARDTAITYHRGAVGPTCGPLAIGHFNKTTRNGNGDRMFRGMLDNIRIHGSTVGSSGALDLAEIRQLQNR
jgi:hypothetical protein